MLSTNPTAERSHCEFCDEFAGGTANSFAQHYGNEMSTRTIFEQDGFRALPSLGQIVPGYLLLIPNQHYRSFADMSPDELDVADVLKTSLTHQMHDTYGDCLFFEHGARTPYSGGCGISHAHLHIVPFPAAKDPVGELIREFPLEEVSNLLELKRIQPGKSYLYYESVHGNKYVLYPPYIPSQYIRRLLANALGIQAWDWRHCGREEGFLSTLEQTSRMRALVRR